MQMNPLTDFVESVSINYDITPLSGTVRAFKKNGFVMIQISSLRFSDSMSSETNIFTVGALPYADESAPFVLASSATSDDPVIGLVQKNTGKVFIRNYIGGHYISGTVIFLAK
jgi:hypothetical protein